MHNTGLQPGTEYEVRVLAATKEGWPSLLESDMPWTEVSTPPLTGSSPLLPPPTVQLTVINATTIQVILGRSFIKNNIFFFHVVKSFSIHLPVHKTLIAFTWTSFNECSTSNRSSRDWNQCLNTIQHIGHETWHYRNDTCRVGTLPSTTLSIPPIFPLDTTHGRNAHKFYTTSNLKALTLPYIFNL